MFWFQNREQLLINLASASSPMAFKKTRRYCERRNLFLEPVWPVAQLVGWLQPIPQNHHVYTCINHPSMVGLTHWVPHMNWQSHTKNIEQLDVVSQHETSNLRVAMLKISRQGTPDTYRYQPLSSSFTLSSPIACIQLLCTTPSHLTCPWPGWKRAQCFKPNLSPASMVMMGSPEGTRGIPRLKLWMDSTWSGSRTEFRIDPLLKSSEHPWQGRIVPLTLMPFHAFPHI